MHPYYLLAGSVALSMASAVMTHQGAAWGLFAAAAVLYLLAYRGLTR
jgi:hypothetical protein